VTLGLVATIVAMILSQFVPENAMQALQARFAQLHLAAQGVALALGFFVIDALGPTGVLPFIYFQF
jgi:hypothetical protein